MNITKEALIERGFEDYGILVLKLTGKNGVRILVIKKKTVQVRFLSNVVAVPNCTTMEHIDQLINLFIV